MFLPPFFESKKFKIIYAVTMGLLLLMIVSLKIYDSFCEHSTVGIILIVFMKTAKRNLQAVPMVKEFITVLSFLTNHKNIIIHQRGEILLHLYQENTMVIPILPGRVIRMMSVTMMTRMILPMIGLMNLETEIMMVDTMMRMTTGKKTEIR